MKEELGIIYFRNYDTEGFYYVNPKYIYNHYTLEWQLITINLN